MAKYNSNRQQNLKIGISSYTENNTVLEVTGKVGIGTTNATQELDVAGDVRLRGGLYDNYNQVGIAGSILISTGAGVSWTNPYAAGLQGLQGNQGLQGLQGNQGLTGPIAGSDTQVIFNDGGIAGASSNFTFNKNLSTVQIGGAAGTGIGINTNTITGPSEITIDPSAIGNNSGAVRIKGDLYVDGTQTIINSTTIELADFIVGIASTATTDALADGAGIKIGPDNTFLYNYNGGTNSSLKSSESLNVALGKNYQIDQVDVLSSTTLGSGVTISNLRSVNPGLINDRTELSASPEDYILYYDITDGQLKKSTIQNAALQGVQGTQGRQGTQGLQGAQGLKGDQGTQGLQGHQGLQGNQGTQGLSNQGVQGHQGHQGTQGLSNQGVQGHQGLQGNQGAQGLSNQGVQGHQGTQGQQGTQGLSNQGVQGHQGTQGLKGDQGTQGLSNQGVQGHQGTQGLKGDQGTQGLSNQGVQGHQGLQGNQGTQGLSNQGVQGHQGTQGLKGDQGVQGTGNQGVQGTQGLKGDQGTQGLQGLQGQTGPVAGSANQVVYKDGSNNPTGSNNLTFNGTQLNVYDLNVQNSLTIGGTSVYITATELRVQDKEIVLGLTTSSLPTDTTANHGGIAIASTEGTPLVPFQVGTANTLPDTYKQIMWVRSGTYSGLGTDAWLFNYGVGIGSTQVPNGVRLAAGGMQVTDSTISSPQINISGIGTFDKIDVNQLSPNGINYGASSQVPVADGLGGWSWQPVASAGAATSIFIEDEGVPKGGVTTLDFVGAGITASVVGSTATITLEISSLQGSQGLQGLQGNQGVQGLQGLSNQGAQGSQGRQGLQGLSNQGVQGTQGLQGLSNQGVQGSGGSQGNQGLQGLSNQGVQGTQGTQGLQGVQGLSNQGVQGSGGSQGNQGLQGLSNQGVQGTQGLKGDQGTQGLQGVQSTQGLQGIQGNNNGGVTVVNDVSTNALRYIVFEDVTSGVSTNVGVSSTKLTFNPSTGNVGLGTTNPVATLQVKDALAFETTNTTTTTTSQVAVDTFATATFRSAKYHVQLTCPGQIATLGGITTGGRGYTSGTYNVTFTTSSGNGSAAQGTLTVSNGTVGSLSIISGGANYTAGDVLTASGGSGLQVSVGTTNVTGAILTLGSITSAGIGYTAGVGVGTTTLTFLGGTGTSATGLATIFDGVITSSTLLQQPTTGTGGTVYYSGSNYSTASVLSVDRTTLTNTIITITGSVGVSTFTSLTAHGLFVNDIIRSSSTSNGLTAGSDYYVVTTPDTTSFTLGTSVGIGTTFTTGSSLSIGFYRNSSNAGGQVAYTNAITGVSTNYQVSDLLILQNGSTVDYVEYAGIANNDILGNFAADISGANARLLLTPTYPNNNVKVARQVMTL